MIIKKSIEHLKNNKMYYGEHLIFAFGHGIRCLFAGLFLIIHSIVPALFPSVGSRLVTQLNKSFTDHNNRPLNEDNNPT